MCLIDTTDGVVMLGAYGWAFVQPMRKLFYNLTITFVSFVIALVVGGLEALSVVAAHGRLEGGMWAYVNVLSDNSGAVGYAIIGLLLVSWAVSVVIYRIAKLDRFDDVAAPSAGHRNGQPLANSQPDVPNSSARRITALPDHTVATTESTRYDSHPGRG
jgi:hypothetical protein